MLKALREIPFTRVIVFHPKDTECGELVAQIRRIGCHVEAIWPPEDEIPSGTGIVFLLFRQDILTKAVLKVLAEKYPTVPVVAIVEFESPSVIEDVVNSGTKAIITKPIRPFGLLTTITLSISVSHQERNYLSRIGKLEQKMSGLKRLERAKSILMSRKSINEQEAYEVIRARAMSLRVPLDTVCSSLIEASEALDWM